MPKRKLAALEKVDADLYITLSSFHMAPLTNSQSQPPAQDPKGPYVSLSSSPGYYISWWFRSYVEDFRAQYMQYENHREIFMASPTSATDGGIVSLRDLIDFISHVADCYRDITQNFPQDLIQILQEHHHVLEPELREKVVGSLVLLRKKELIDSTV